MKYMIKFGNYSVFAEDYVSALQCGVALAKTCLMVQVWQGSKLIWDYNNS